MIGWSDDALQRAVFVRTLQRVLELKRNLLVFEEAELPVAQLERRMDIWWRAKENGSLMLTLAHLIQDAPRYREHSIRVLRIIEDEAGRQPTEDAMRQLLSDARINAEVEVYVSRESPMALIARVSGMSAVCFVGLSVRTLAEQENPLASFTSLVAALKGNLFITKSWHDLEL
jgi:hypothetical protein